MQKAQGDEQKELENCELLLCNIYAYEQFALSKSKIFFWKITLNIWNLKVSDDHFLLQLDL